MFFEFTVRTILFSFLYGSGKLGQTIDMFVNFLKNVLLLTNRSILFLTVSRVVFIYTLIMLSFEHVKSVLYFSNRTLLFTEVLIVINLVEVIVQ